MMTLSHRESPIRLRLDLSRKGFSKRADRVRGTILLLLAPAFFSIAPKVSNGMRRARADDSAFAQAEGEETTRLLEQKIASVTTPDVEGLARALLAWDGERWRVSPLDPPPSGQGGQRSPNSEIAPVGARIISASGEDQMMVLLLYAAPARALYPMVYEIKGHAASLVWDSMSEDTRYQALTGGRIEFEEAKRGAVPAMVASGKADPGLLVFGRDGARGFQARTVYRWIGNQYVPATTEYEANEDFRLYEFISALHLHNYKAAYDL